MKVQKITTTLLILTILLSTFSFAQASVHETLVTKAQELLKAGDYNNALKHINQALRMPRRSRERVSLLLKAEILYKGGDKKNATKILTNLLNKNRKDKDAVRLYLEINPPIQTAEFERKRLLAVLHRRMKSAFAKRHILTADDYAMLAEDALKQSAPVRAETMIQTAIRKNPDEIRYHTILANIYQSTGKFHYAAETFDRMAEMSKNSWTLLFKAGKFYRKAGWTDIALDRYSRTQTMVPNNKEVLIELMDTAKASGNTDLYLSIMERQVGNLLTEPKYYRERASAYIKEGKWSKAIKDLEVCAKPLNFEASGEMYLLELLQFIDSGKSSVKFVERPVIVTSVFKEDQRNLFRKSGETFFKQPRGKGSKKNMARILHKLRYHNDALRILSDVIKQDDDAEAWWLMAKIYQVKGEISEVNPALLSSRQADPTFVPTRLWLARVYLDGEHFEQANFELDAVLKINSRNFEALLLLAELYFEISNREEMNDVLEKLKKLQPDSLELQKLLEKVE